MINTRDFDIYKLQDRIISLYGERSYENSICQDYSYNIKNIYKYVESSNLLIDILLFTEDIELISDYYLLNYFINPYIDGYKESPERELKEYCRKYRRVLFKNKEDESIRIIDKLVYKDVYIDNAVLEVDENNKLKISEDIIFKNIYKYYYNSMEILKSIRSDDKVECHRLLNNNNRITHYLSTKNKNYYTINIESSKKIKNLISRI